LEGEKARGKGGGAFTKKQPFEGPAPDGLGARRVRTGEVRAIELSRQRKKRGKGCLRESSRSRRAHNVHLGKRKALRDNIMKAWRAFEKKRLLAAEGRGDSRLK